MQQDEFKKVVGEIFKELRSKKYGSISKFACEYDFDRGNLSKVERGIINCRLATAWKFCEALGIDFCDFAKMLKERLGRDFTLLDE